MARRAAELLVAALPAVGHQVEWKRDGLRAVRTAHHFDGLDDRLVRAGSRWPFEFELELELGATKSGVSGTERAAGGASSELALTWHVVSLLHAQRAVAAQTQVAHL